MVMQTSNSGREPPNRFLQHLSPADRSLLERRLEPMPLIPGTCLLDEDARVESVYFPSSGIVSIEQRAEGSRRIETALVGYEGMVGWSGLIGFGRSTSSATVQMQPGTALRISVADFASACAASATLLTAVMHFIEVMMVQMAQAIVSLLRDPMEKRVSRWLLMRHDRITTDQLFVRHDEISACLCSRRASVTDTLHVLEGERLLHGHRGCVVIRNRDGLERRAGESYGPTEAHYRRLIGPFGRGFGKPLTPDIGEPIFSKLD